MLLLNKKKKTIHFFTTTVSTALWGIFVFLITKDANAQLTYRQLDKRYSVANLKQDIDFVKNKLEELHPNLYWFITKPALTKKFDSLKNVITQTQTLSQFQYQLASVLSYIGDGHLALSFNIDAIEAAEAVKSTTKTYPIQQLDFKIVNNKVYIVKNRAQDNTIPIGAEVTAFNNIPANEVIDRLCQSLSSDGYNKTLKYLLLTNARLPYIFTQLYGLNDTLTLAIRENGIEKNIILTSMPLQQLPGHINRYETAEFKTPVNAPAYLKPGTFERKDPFLGRMGFQAAPFKDPYVDFFERMKKSKSTCLILDLRDNAGGDYEVVTKVFSYLIRQPAYFALVSKKILDDVKKTPSTALKSGITSPINPDTNSFTGKLYVLINAGSFSATALLAANLQANNRAIFVGEESSGGRDGCTGGSFQNIQLPNTNLILSFGNIPFKISKAGPLKGRGVIPDVFINYNIEDYLRNKDLEIGWVNNDMARYK